MLRRYHSEAKQLKINYSTKVLILFWNGDSFWLKNEHRSYFSNMAPLVSDRSWTRKFSKPQMVNIFCYKKTPT
jgi:hypothetical protein